MTLDISIEHIGGIRSGNAAITPGLNAVRASNWQGKSSLILAIETVMGTETPLMDGAERGEVRLTNAETYHVELTRTEGTVVANGTPFLTDEKAVLLASLFAFLDEGNEVRAAVRRGGNLEDLLTRPLDLENIEERISRKRRERDEIEAELSAARDATDRLADVQETVTQLETKLDTLRAKRANIKTGRQETSELSQKRDELSSLRAERASLDGRIDRLETSIERLRSQREAKRDRLDEIEIPDVPDVEADLREKRTAVQELEHDIELLESVYSANMRVLEENRLDLLAGVDHGVLEDGMVCWLCDQETPRESIEAGLADVANRISALREDASTRREEIESLEATLSERDAAQRRARQLEEEIQSHRSKLTEKEQSLASARNRREEVHTEIDRLADQVEELDDERTDLEGEIKYAERELEEQRETLDDLQAKATRRESLAEERERLTQEIEDLRTRRDRIQRELRQRFDESIAEIVDLFSTGFDSARLTPQFDLVVARDGREADIGSLSEGEREILGIVTALAGFETFDVADHVPVMLLDGIGGFAEANLKTLIEYLDQRTEYCVFTAYPEHDGFEGNVISLADISVITNERAASS